MTKVKLFKVKRSTADSYVGGTAEYLKFLKYQALEHIHSTAFEPIYLSIISKAKIESTAGDMLKLKLTTDIDDPNRDIVACYRINEHLAMYYDGEIYFTAFYYNWGEHQESPALLRSGSQTMQYVSVALDYLTRAKKYGLLDHVKVVIAFVFKSD